MPTVARGIEPGAGPRAALTGRRQARYWCSLNGKTVLTYDGRGDLPPAVRLELKPGENHFVAKITNNRHSYGFSFAIAGLHPAPERPGANEYPWRPFRSYRENDLPYFVAGGKPAWYVSGKTWWDALWASAKARRAQSVPDEGPEIVLADFEGPDYGHWKATGEAFGAGPARGTLPRQMEVTGFQGKGLVNRYLQGDGATGTLTSPAFKIERNGITFLIGGGRKPGRCCINLLVGGEAVRTATGRDNERLEWQHWDVGEFRGRTGVLQIVDHEPGGWGHVNVDQITLGARKGPAAMLANNVWAALQQEFTDAKSRDEGAWIAWQFHRADSGDGVVEAFRRATCDDAAKTFRLGSLDPAARYEVTDLETGKTAAVAGKSLMDEGLSVEIGAKPGAATVTYRRLETARGRP